MTTASRPNAAFKTIITSPAYDPAFKPVHVENAKDERKEISRKNFIEACETLTAEDEKIFENVFRRIGHSYDWNLTYSTISPSSIKISQASFLDLYKKGKVVAVEAPIMWDVRRQGNGRLFP